MNLEQREFIMHCTVIVRPETGDRFVARPLGLPELEASASSEAEAVEEVKHKLDEWFRGAKVVEVCVSTGNPWLDFAGSSADDPNWEEYQAEIKRYRAAMDAEYNAE
jgi:hypothetical protein